MDWYQLATLIGAVGSFLGIIIWMVNRIDNDVNKLGDRMDKMGDRIDKMGIRLDGHAQRIDQLYTLILDIVRKDK